MQIFDIQIRQNRQDATEHGAAAFPLAVYHSVMSRNVLGFTNWHWHDELQLCLVTEGEICFFANDRQHSLTAGQGIFINSGRLHMARPAGNPDSAYICLNAHPRLLASFPGSIMESRYVTPGLKNPAMGDIPLYPGVLWQKELLDGILKVCRLYESREFGYEPEICLILTSMWLSLLRNLQQDAPVHGESGARGSGAVQKILAYISLHYSERITLADVAEELSFSAGECCRMFKRITGETIISYLTLYRISKSTELLRDTGLSVSQIAYETGFSSTSYFIEKFRERLGTTPLRFRKSLEKL